MGWLSLCVEIDAARAEAFSDALIEAGAISVSLEDADAGSGKECALFAEPAAEPVSAPQDAAPALRTAVPPLQAWRRNRVRALAPQDCDPGALLRTACAATGIALPPYETGTVPDQDWVRATQSQFAPQRAGERIWIVPSWHAPPPQPGAIVVRLDPGLAFGTGTHPSTQLALGWLERRARQGARVLDYGCGSGILAIVAARLGCAQVDAVDIDPQATAAAAANAARNRVAVRCWLPDALPPGQYDVVLANILAHPLIVLAPLLAARTRQAGRIALAGILSTQAAEVMAAYHAHFELAPAGDEDGWTLIEGVRR